MGAILADAWSIYRRNGLLLTAMMLMVWSPCELLSSWVTYHVLADSEWRSRLFLFILDALIGSISVSGMYSILKEREAGRSVTLSSALLAGFNLWMPMFLTRFISHLAIYIGYLFLILPGIYLTIRLILVEVIVVMEGTSGFTAAFRSEKLTDGHFWRIGATLLTAAVTMFVLSYAFFLPIIFVPALNNWITYAAAAIMGNVASIFYYPLLWAIYRDIAIKTSPERLSGLS